MSEKWMTSEDVARYLGIHKRTVYNMVRDGRLRGVRIGRGFKFTEEDVKRCLDERRTA